MSVGRLISLVCLVHAGCTAPHRAPKPPPADASQPVETVPAVSETPFRVAGADGTTFVAPEGCFTELEPPWNVMVGLDPARACDYDSEDGFSLLFDLLAADPGAPRLPQPGQVYTVDLGGPHGVGPARVTVLRHERPFVVVSISPVDPAAPSADGRTYGGVMRIRHTERAASSGEGSWVP